MRPNVFIVIAVLAGAASGCVRAQAKTEPERPPLQVPEPPPRAIAPMEPEAQSEPVAAAASPARPTRRPPPRSAAAKPDTPKDEPKPEIAASRPEDASAPRTSTAEAPQLRMPQTANEAEVERKVRDLLGRAARTLKGVNYSALNTDAKSQYDTAKRFIQQAEDAVKGQNFVFASYLADKADTLARGLVGR